MKRSTFIVFAILVGTLATRVDAVPVPVSSIKPLLLEALAKGEAHGVLIGSIRDAMKQRFQTDAPIKVDVKRVGTHRQPGCARLAVRTRQANVVLPAAAGMPPNAPTSMMADYQIDYCNTGRYPQGEQGK